MRKRTKPRHCNRRSWRNEAITLRALLKVACTALALSSVPLPEPLASWWRVQRELDWLKLPRKEKLRAEITPDMVQRQINDTEAD